MVILSSNTIGNIIINIILYAVLFNIIYSIFFSEIKYPKSVSLIAYIIVMEVKLFIAPGRISLLTFCISSVVYLILGLIIVKILDEMANYKSRKSFVVISIIIGYLAELLLARILYVALSVVICILELLNWIIMFYFKTLFSDKFNLD